ncbi:uncharacterized protein KY384_005189 [Bacidia gigantensis]|uniref:uncharacterized protein n=1 Tax=Bacidia gigantensis TaxID=2732470 RepID=UPI001D045984|nr:uncharacterized protein KY384_005189 [Bacidia gigantensis]KAG8529708.1 hypothetical protein KY384_005189 [Bacidia gigantensis]
MHAPSNYGLTIITKICLYLFHVKNGGALKLSVNHQEGYADFIGTGGSQNYSWNVIRSEADEIMYKHAGESGAKTFDGIKVNTISFQMADSSAEHTVAELGRPVSASWTRKNDKATGIIKFDYIVDASGRAGLLSTRYLKARKYNQSLKNVAMLAYFKDAATYGKGTVREGAPFFEALHDESGWAWTIPLHDGTMSVGVVMSQEIAAKAKAIAADNQEYYNNALKQTPKVLELLSRAKQVSELKSASDYSYHSHIYAVPFARIVGDAGCFIDPFFASGVHLAITAGLSAATTIASSIRGDCDEAIAADWHSVKVRQSYKRFLLIVLCAYKQMRNQSQAVLSDFGEDNIDKALNFFKPVIQGAADATNEFKSNDLEKSMDFVYQSLLQNPGKGTHDLSTEEEALGDPYSFASGYLPYDAAIHSPKSQHFNEKSGDSETIYDLASKSTPYAAVTSPQASARQPEKKNESSPCASSAPYDVIVGAPTNGSTPNVAVMPYKAVLSKPAKASNPYAASTPYELLEGKSYQNENANANAAGNKASYYQDAPDFDGFTTNVVDGRVPRVEKGNLGLVAVKV